MRLFTRSFLCSLVCTAVFAAAAASAVPAAAAVSATPTPSPTRLLGMIRHVYRSHRPPPPYVTYTLERLQYEPYGYKDYAESYTYHIWCRTSDRAALGRKVYRDDFFGRPEFQRPEFNEDRDPGPPTADIFERAPAHPEPISVVPTPEPLQTPLRTIGAVVAYGESDYNVVSVDTEGNLLHLKLTPKRDPDRNRLRDLWVDKNTLEIVKFVATDKLFVAGDKIYPVLFTGEMRMLDGFPVIVAVHGVVLGGYEDDGGKVDFYFRDIRFPKSLPSWYFEPQTYGQHMNDLPE